MGLVPAPKIPLRLGRYEVIRHLATGGMAEIYLAQGIGEKVVVKVISPERAQDQKFIHMFLDEARVAATLHHPNICQMLEVGRHGDTYFFAMEYIHGETVRALLERAVASHVRLPLAVCLKIISSVATGLHHAHERKGGTGAHLAIVHRDVTPSNIMLGFDGSVKLLDFGIAQAEGRAAETQSGTIKGKFAYMSPEQCRGKAVDRRTDVFALGIVLYELTTQRRAFRTDSDFDTMDRIVRGRLLKPSAIDASYPRELEQILLRAMATDPDERYPTAADFGRAIDDFAARTGHVASPDDIAACLREVLGTTDVETRAAPEGTMSDVEMSVSPGIAASLHESSLGGSTIDEELGDLASTQRRVRAPIAAALAQAAAEQKAESELDAATTGAFEPQMTGPMPVLSTVRPTGPLDVAVPASVLTTGPNPQVSTGISGPNPVIAAPASTINAPAAAPVPRPATQSQNRRPPSMTGPSPFAPPGAPAPMKTMMGSGIALRSAPSGVQSAAAPGATSQPPGTSSQPPGTSSQPPASASSSLPPASPLVDSGRRAVMVPIRPPTRPPDGTGTAIAAGETGLHRRHRRGLVLAIVAVVVVAIAIAGVIVLGGRDAASDAPAAVPAGP